MNTANPLYKFLSFYRVVEGIEKIRGEKRELVSTAGEKYREPSERIPSRSRDLPKEFARWEKHFTPFWGKKFRRVREELQHDVRDVIVHLNPMEDPLMPDRFTDIGRIESINHVLHYVSREMIENEIRDPAFSCPWQPKADHESG